MWVNKVVHLTFVLEYVLWWHGSLHRHSKLGNREEFITSNRKYQPFPLLKYFFVVVSLRWLYHHMLSVYSCTYVSWESWVSFLYCDAVLWCAQLIEDIMARLFPHYATSLSFHYCYQTGSVNHLSLFRARSWTNGMRCIDFVSMDSFSMSMHWH